MVGEQEALAALIVRHQQFVEVYGSFISGIRGLFAAALVNSTVASIASGGSWTSVERRINVVCLPSFGVDRAQVKPGFGARGGGRHLTAALVMPLA